MFTRFIHSLSRGPLGIVIFASVAAFSTYFCMYAFRKPFTVASYEQVQLVFGLDFKSALVIAQVMGYAVSKFIGIKVVSEMSSHRRCHAILTLVMASQLALIAFAIVPGNWKLLALFLNGLPLGIIWGLVFSYLEGRKFTEIMGAVLSVSFIVSSGVVKTVGQYLMQATDINEFWMPAATGAIFTLPLFLSVYCLSKIPPPSSQDISQRKARKPMTGQDRVHLLNRYFIGLTCLTLSYMLLTALRDFSDNFAAEIWRSLGYGDEPHIFSLAALYTSLAVLLILGTMVSIKNNFHAFMLNHVLIITGFACLGFGSLLFQEKLITGLSWMILLKTAVYLAYIPFNCLIFDRMLTMVNGKANAGFLIYVADAMGYAGSVGILVYRSVFELNLSWVHFLIDSTYFASLTGIALMFCSMLFFHNRIQLRNTAVCVTKQRAAKPHLFSR